MARWYAWRLLVAGTAVAVVAAAVVAEDTHGAVALDIAPDDRRAAALRLVDTTDMSKRAVAREVGVSEATVRRWLKPQSRAHAV